MALFDPSRFCRDVSATAVVVVTKCGCISRRPAMSPVNGTASASPKRSATMCVRSTVILSASLFTNSSGREAAESSRTMVCRTVSNLRVLPLRFTHRTTLWHSLRAVTSAEEQFLMSMPLNVRVGRSDWLALRARDGRFERRPISTGRHVLHCCCVYCLLSRLHQSNRPRCRRSTLRAPPVKPRISRL